MSFNTATTDIDMPTTPPLNAFLHAMWLTDGDEAAAARLLRVPVAALGMHLQDAYVAQAAFCERPACWRPEDSLCSPASCAGENGNSYRIQKDQAGGTTVLQGLVRRDGDSSWIPVARLEHQAGDACWQTKQMPTADTPAPLSRVVACLNELLVQANELLRSELEVTPPVLEITTS